METIHQPKIGLRQAINDHCKSCIYDSAAAGNWRQQVSVCQIKDCALYPVRPQSRTAIPESVLKYYGLPIPINGRKADSGYREGPLSEHNGDSECPRQGWAA